jgi:hypothetical protein
MSHKRRKQAHRQPSPTRPSPQLPSGQHALTGRITLTSWIDLMLVIDIILGSGFFVGTAALGLNFQNLIVGAISTAIAILLGVLQVRANLLKSAASAIHIHPDHAKTKQIIFGLQLLFTSIIIWMIVSQEIIPFVATSTAKYSYPPAGAETVFSSPFTALHHPTWLKVYEKRYKDDAVSCLFTGNGLQARSSIADSFSHATSACQLYYASTEEPELTAFTFEAHIMLTHGCGGIAWGGENLNTNGEYYAFIVCREEHFYTLSRHAHTNIFPLATASLGQDDLPHQQPSVLAISSDGKMQRIYLNHRLLAEAHDTSYPLMTRIALLVGPSGGNQGDLLASNITLWKQPTA